MIKKTLKSILNKFNYNISRTDNAPGFNKLKPICPEHFFDMYFSSIQPESFYFVQIGAHDGNFVDPIHDYIIKYNLSGLLVEPQPDLFRKLKDTYSKQQGLTFANVAVSNSSATIYTIKEQYMTEAFKDRGTGIASLNKEDFEKGLARELRRLEVAGDTSLTRLDMEELTQAIPVVTNTLSELFLNNNVTRVDYVQIDCQGYDYEIIKMLNFNRCLPSIINYESHFLSEADQVECEKYLESKGYQTFRYGSDTCAFHLKPKPALK